MINKEIDFIFIEFYIKKLYNIKLEEYFKVTKQAVSEWRKLNILPSKRIAEFLEKEKSINPLELIHKLY